MENTLKISPAETTSYPHNGKLLTNYILNNRVNRVELARKMNVTPPTIYNYVKSESLQLNILWNASLALKHNFVAELAAILPVEFVTEREKGLQLQLETLQKEIEKLNLELSIYKTIVGK